MKSLAPLVATALMSGCVGDETVTAYAPVGQSFWLQSINGEVFDGQASIRFDSGGAVTGAAPCNSYAAGVTVPYPWFELGPIRATRAACPDLDKEGIFFAALARMSFAEANGPVLILTNEDAEEMVFELPTDG